MQGINSPGTYCMSIVDEKGVQRFINPSQALLLMTKRQFITCVARRRA